MAVEINGVEYVLTSEGEKQLNKIQFSFIYKKRIKEKLEAIVSEIELIQRKESKLSRRQREFVEFQFKKYFIKKQTT